MRGGEWNGRCFRACNKIIVDRLGVEETEVVPAASFQGRFRSRLLDVVELVMQLEDEFEMEISDEDAEKIATVGDAVTYIESHL